MVLDLARTFPEAAIHTSVYAPALTYPEFRDLDVRPTALDRVPYFRTHHRAAFPCYAPAFSALRVDADVVVCSSSGWAHGVRTDGAKLVYCRGRALAHAARALPRAAARRPGRGRRRGTRRRRSRAARVGPPRRAIGDALPRELPGGRRRAVAEQYGIDARVVHPAAPRITAAPTPVAGIEPGFFLCVSRLLPYKNVDVVCEAFRRLPDQRLVVVGTGPMLAELRASAPPNVHLLLHVEDAELRWCYEQSRALVAASHEDFGLTVLEAAGAGRPTVALRAGGYLETVLDGRTGVFFDAPDAAGIAHAVMDLDRRVWDPDTIRAHADEFSLDRFVAKMREQVAELAG
ncbi:MAG: glycosyltransferase [Acidimicrobiia bacterium]